MIHHENSGSCKKCLEIFDRYPGFYQPLKGWFLDLQLKYPEAHISCAGRGKVDQEDCFQRGVSKAQWLESAHNFNIAIDIFKQEGVHALWPLEWYELILIDLPPDFTWYGKPGSAFRELPHIQASQWKSMGLKPVE